MVDLQGGKFVRGIRARVVVIRKILFDEPQAVGHFMQCYLHSLIKINVIHSEDVLVSDVPRNERHCGSFSILIKYLGGSVGQIVAIGIVVDVDEENLVMSSCTMSASYWDSKIFWDRGTPNHCLGRLSGNTRGLFFLRTR